MKQIFFASIIVLKTISFADSFSVGHPFKLNSFVTKPFDQATNLNMVGGKGWENDSFLDSLNGNENEREDANEKYEKFKETRQQFMKRQEEAMKNPQYQKFMEMRMNQQMEQQKQDTMMRGEGPGGDMDDMMNPYAEEMSSGGNSQGGTRFQNMMSKSRQMQQQRQQGFMQDPLMEEDDKK